MIRRVSLASLLFILLAVGVFGSSASAHVLKTNGSIGGALHIEPDDNPVAGRPTTYVLVLTDDSDTLNLSKCDCNVAIQQNGKTIDSRPMNATTSTESKNSYTFEKPDVYTLQFSGKPTNNASFKPFRLSYIVRVTGAGGTSNSQQMPVLIWAGMAMMIGLILLAAYAMEIGYNDKQ